MRACAVCGPSPADRLRRALLDTVAIAGHRTTYLAPFRTIDQLRRGQRVILEMPYGGFPYRVEKKRLVAPTATKVKRRVSYDRVDSEPRPHCRQVCGAACP